MQQTQARNKNCTVSKCKILLYIFSACAVRAHLPSIMSRMSTSPAGRFDPAAAAAPSARPLPQEACVRGVCIPTPPLLADTREEPGTTTKGLLLQPDMPCRRACWTITGVPGTAVTAGLDAKKWWAIAYARMDVMRFSGKQENIFEETLKYVNVW